MYLLNRFFFDPFSLLIFLHVNDWLSQITHQEISVNNNKKISITFTSTLIHAGFIYSTWVCWTLINFDEINHKKLSNRSKDFILIRLTFSCSKGVKRTILQHWHGFSYSFIQIVIVWHFDFPVLFIYTCDIWINANKARQIN